MAVASGTMTLSNTAVAVTPGPCREVSLHNDEAALIIKVGTSATQTYTLGPGQTVKLAVANRNQVWVKCSTVASPVMTWIST